MIGNIKRFGTIFERCRKVTMDIIEKRIEQTINDREHGSRWLVKEATEILRDLALMQELSENERMDRLLATARRIAHARPAMAALSSAVSQVLNVEGGTREVACKAQQVLETFVSATTQITEHARPLLRGHVMTCSISGTVLDVLLALREQIEHVTVLEGRPRYEGRETARLLGQQGIVVTFITDAQADIFLPQCQCVVVGADSVMINGDVLNKAGTALLAWAAHGRNIPFYVLCETLKISPRRWVDHDPAHQAANFSLLEEKEADEVWEPDVPGITVRNFYFDRTPYRLITHILTERGILDRRAIREVAVETRLNQRKVLVSVSSSGSRKDIDSRRLPTGKAYLSNPGESSENALGSGQ
jgi:ribose 1,5-bisphosphate isomerase